MTHPFAPAPQWLLDETSRYEPRAHRPDPTVELDLPASIARAIDYLENAAPEAIENAFGDNTTYAVANRVMDFGVSEEKAAELMLDHWNEQKAHPPWSPDDLERKVGNAWRYRKDAPGAAAPEAHFKVEETPEPPRPRLYALHPSEVSPNLDTVDLVKGVLGTGAMSVLYGESNTGKTFIMLDIAFHVATGRPWMGRKTLQGWVLYVAAEAGRSALDRVQALKLKYGTDDFPLYLVPCPVDLLHKGADTKPLIQLGKEYEEKLGAPPALIVIDTLARAMAGGNENASDDMGCLIANLDTVRNAFRGAHLSVVHHSGKDTAKGARGHSSLRAATDTELEVADRVVRSRKQRDKAEMAPIRFDLEVVELGRDRDGDRVTSCVVVQVAGAVGDFGRQDLTGEEAEWLDALEAAGGDERPIGRRDWESAWLDLHSDRYPPMKESTLKKKCQRIAQTLTDKGWVLRDTRGTWRIKPGDGEELMC